MRYFILFAFLLGPLLVAGQVTDGLVAYYSFDDCTVKDNSENNSDGILFGEPDCGCGVSGNGLLLNNSGDYALLSGNVENYFDDGVFSLSFYFRTTDPFGTHDILSKRENCVGGPAFAIRYTPSTQNLYVELSESDSNQVTFSERLDGALCWIHLILVRKASSISLFVNSELIATKNIFGRMDISSPASLFIGNGPCVGMSDRRFSGIIDEIKVFNRPINEIEIQDLYLEPDRILTPDTTIYQGSGVNIRIDNSCTDQFQWNGSVDIVSPNDPFTQINPSNSDTYTLNFEYPSCVAQDSINIIVIDPSQIECGNVPLPSAFTPNNDGKNDVFFISNPFAVEELIYFRILDRWGNIMFQTKNISEKWDGTYLGKEINPGPYVYQIEYRCQNEDQFKSGTVMLIR